MAADQGYVHPELLAEPDWVWDRRNDPSLRIIDCATLEKYQRAHIPGAVGLPLPPRLKEGGTGLHIMEPEPFAELMGQLGVTADTTVVTYDDVNAMYAARCWWALNYYGHTKVKILNGGWQRWVSEGRPVTWQPTVPPAGNFTPRPNEALMCRLDDLLADYQDPHTQVLDVLYAARYRGLENPAGNQRVGHIPGARNLPIEGFFTDDDRRVFRPAAELRELLADAGMSPEKETIVYCQAGVRMTVGAFVLALLGWGQVRAYDASMAEWANRDDTPLVVEPS